MKRVLLGLAILLGLSSSVQGQLPVTANRIIRGFGVPSPTLCSILAHVGKVYIRLDAGAANSSFYTCDNTAASTYAWELGGGGGGGSSCSGDINAGCSVVTKTNGVAFAASATTNALNATNISSGTLAPQRQATQVYPCNSASASTTAYTCTTGYSLGAYADGQVFMWRPDVSCAGGATTLNVDGLGAKSIFTPTTSNPTAPYCSVAIPSSSAGPYIPLVYNAAESGFYIEGIFLPGVGTQSTANCGAGTILTAAASGAINAQCPSANATVSSTGIIQGTFLNTGTTDTTAQINAYRTTAGVLANMVGDGTYADFQFTSYRNNQNTHGLFLSLAARGTKASPVTTPAGDSLFSIRASGYGASDFGDILVDDSAAIDLVSAASFTNTSFPGRVWLRTLDASGAPSCSSALCVRLVAFENGDIMTGSTVGSIAAGAGLDVARNDYTTNITFRVWSNQQDQSSITRAQIREGAVQAANEVFGVYANNGTTKRIDVTNNIFNVTSTLNIVGSSFTFNGKTCVLSGSAISCT